MSLNKVMLIGYLGNNPDIKTMQNGNQVANLSVATTKCWKDKITGELKSISQWHRITIFNERIIKFLEGSAKKGNKVYVEGELTYRKYQDKDGIEKNIIEIVVNSFTGEIQLLGETEKSHITQYANKVKSTMNNTSNTTEHNFSVDDEIPF